MEYDSEDGPWDPISGGASALLGTLGSLAMGFADFPVEILKALRIKPAEESKSKTGSASEPVSRSGTLEAQAQPPNTVSHAPTIQENHRSNTGLPGSLHHRSTRHAEEASVHRSVSGASVGPESLSSHHSHRSHAGNQAGQISLEAVLGAGKGIGRIVGAGLKSPMDFTLSLARGFHNAPKLYGDESVRQADKVTGMHSGLKAAGKVRSLWGGVFTYMLTDLGIWPRVLRWHIRFGYSAF